MESINNRNILKHVNEIELNIRKLKKEKKDIQQNCNHEEHWYIDFDKNKSIKKYCSICKKELGYANQTESHNFLKPKGKKNT